MDASPSRRAAFASCFSGIPVMRSTRSGQKRETTLRTRSKPVVARVNEFFIEVAFFNGEIEETIRQRNISSRRDLKVEGSEACGGSVSRIDDYERAAVVDLLFKVLHEWRHRFGCVRADQKHCLSVGDIRHRKRQTAIDSERFDRGGGRGGHAKAAVVIDLRSAEGNAGELAEQIGLFVGKTAATEDADGIAAMPLLKLAHIQGDPINRFVPGSRTQSGAFLVSNQRRLQAFRVRQKFGGGPAFRTEPAAVGGEVAGFDGRSRTLVFTIESHAALQGAIGAVRLARHSGSGGDRGTKNRQHTLLQIPPQAGAINPARSAAAAGQVLIHTFFK